MRDATTAAITGVIIALSMGKLYRMVAQPCCNSLALKSRML